MVNLVIYTSITGSLIPEGVARTIQDGVHNQELDFVAETDAECLSIEELQQLRYFRVTFEEVPNPHKEKS